MRTQLIRRTDELEAIADQWRGLTLPSPLQSPDWLIPWWQVYGGGNRELAVLAVYENDGRLVGLCPWYVETRPTGRSLRWLGDGAACSDHAGIGFARNAAPDVTGTIVDWILHADPRCWSRMTLEAVDADNRLLEPLVSGVERRGWLITTRAEPGSCSIALPQSWDDYLMMVSKNHRKRCRKWQREFFDTGRARVEVATEPADAFAAFEQLVLLHNRRRQSAGSCGAFEDARFLRFHQLAIHRLARRGAVQLRLLRVDGQLVAAEYLLVDDDALYAYQSGLCDVGAAVSAGSLSILSLVRSAIDEGRSRVDLLRGAEPYKLSWGAVHRPAQTIIARRPTMAGLLQTCFDNALHQARCFGKRFIEGAQLADSRNVA